MLDRLIRFSLANRALVMAAAVLLLVVGGLTWRSLPVEVLPDLTKPTVVILTEAPGLAPEEVERQVTDCCFRFSKGGLIELQGPLELRNVPGPKRIRRKIDQSPKSQGMNPETGIVPLQRSHFSGYASVRKWAFGIWV